MPVPFLRGVSLADAAPRGEFPFDIAAVREIDQIEFGAVTILAGDNGSGKSTIIEALAVLADFNPEGGGRHLVFTTRDTHSTLHRYLEPRWRRRPAWGWFLRAETFYGMASFVAGDAKVQEVFPQLHEESHGESFLDLMQERCLEPGFYLLDEPEAALSMQGQMILARLIFESTRSGSQFVIATHSPFLMASPQATIYELSESGIEAATFDDLPSVMLWRTFFDDPQHYYELLFADD